MKGIKMKMIYSENNDCMINAGFTYNGNHYTWCECDELYYRDDVDDIYFMGIPSGAECD